MVAANSINVSVTGIVGFTGTGFVSTPVTQHAVIIGGTTSSTLTSVGPVASTGNVLMSNGVGADPGYSTATYPITSVANELLYSSATNIITGLSTAANGVLVTSAGSVPSISSTLPSAVQGNITSVGTIASGTWNGSVITGTYGGTGVNNGASTITLGGSLATSGAFASTFTMSGATSVTFPTSGTLATTSQLPTLPLSLSDGGTNASLVASNGGIFYSTATAGAILSGTATARQMLQSGASGAPAWSTATWPATTSANLVLYSSSANVVDQVAAGSNTQVLTLVAGVPTWQTPTTGTVTSVSGTTNRITSTGGSTPVIDISGSYVGQTSITTLGTITSGTWTATDIALDAGGTNASLVASNGGIFYSTATAGAILAGTATANKVLMSGTSTAPTWSVPVYPNASVTAGKVIISDGTNYVASTPTYPNASVTAGKVIISDGTNYVASTPTYPNTAAGTGTILRADGTNWVATTATYPATTTVNQVLYSSATNVVSGLATANSAVLATNGSGVPSITATPTVTSITFGAGNALSVYVEGTYTPTITGSVSSPSSVTYTNQIGRYTKIGQRVFVDCRLNMSAVTGGSGNVQLDSLPYTSNAASNYRVQGAFMGATATYAASIISMSADLEANNSNCIIYGLKSAANQSTLTYAVAALSGGGGFWFSINYEV